MNRARVLLPVGSRRRKETKRFVKFAIVGALGAATDFTVLFVLAQLAGAPPVVANGFGFSAAVLQNFLLNRWWTFPESRIDSSRRLMVKFVLVSLIGLGLSTLVFVFVHRLMESIWVGVLSDPALGYSVSANLTELFSLGFAKSISIAVVLFWNFTANRLWTFSKGL